MDALNGVFIMPRFNGLVELRAGGNTPLGAKSHKAACVFGKQADLEFCHAAETFQNSLQGWHAVWLHQPVGIDIKGPAIQKPDKMRRPCNRT